MAKVDSIQLPMFEAESPSYERDFHAWSMEQSARLRMLRVPGFDSENLAEEIEALARRNRDEIGSRMRVLLTHLLKWRYQPLRAGDSWRLTIREQRHSLAKAVRDSPSLRPFLAQAVGEEYELAVARAAYETGLLEVAFPVVCEWSVGEVIDDAFYPITGIV